MSKKQIEVRVGENSQVSASYEQFAAIIEAYKKQNPRKYELKKAALEAKLASLK